MKEVPITLSNTELKKALRQYCSFPEETPIYNDTYRGEFSNIKNGSRYINVREIFSKAGIPLKIYIKGRQIITHHFGQMKNMNEQNEMIWKERQAAWQEREKNGKKRKQNG